MINLYTFRLENISNEIVGFLLMYIFVYIYIYVYPSRAIQIYLYSINYIIAIYMLYITQEQIFCMYIDMLGDLTLNYQNWKLLPTDLRKKINNMIKITK